LLIHVGNANVLHHTLLVYQKAIAFIISTDECAAVAAGAWYLVVQKSSSCWRASPNPSARNNAPTVHPLLVARRSSLLAGHSSPAPGRLTLLQAQKLTARSCLMRSKASVKGHPIHPALIPFPIAFLYGALIFDALGVVTDRTALWTTGGHLAIAGIIAGVIAALPGLIDYLYTVPPNSSGKTRATKHLTVNLSALALMAVAVTLRPESPLPPNLTALVLEAVAIALLTAGGWLGGTLVSRNQISVDHRYAKAGKWNEATIEASRSEAVVVATTGELEVNQMKLLHIDGARIVLARTETGWCAFDDHCTHRGGSLADGALICATVQCPWHGSQFDTRTGAVKAGPATDPISTYQVEESGGKVRLLVG
jgi:uncharacterized membrane protein/nitrite reductase/ring-hydroxylating ferredoxin subunit